MTEAMSARDWQLRAAERYRAGDLGGASAALEEAAALEPSDPAYLLNLAELARVTGDLAGAHERLRRGARLTDAQPSPQRYAYLAAAWLDAGRAGEALEAAAAGLRLGESPAGRALFAEAVRGAGEVPESLRAYLARAIDEAWARAEHLAPAAIRLLRENWPETAEAAQADALLAALITAGPVRDLVLEARLTGLRRALLQRDLPPALWPLASRLAQQAFLNEYVWLAGADEAEAAKALADSPATPEALLKLAAYRPLAERADAQELLAQDWPEPVAAVIDQQVRAVVAERALAAAIPAMTAIRAGVSIQVQAQYEANPYPRWRKLPPASPASLAQVVRSALPLARVEPIPNADAPRVLIAGCGTGQHAAQVAQGYAGAQVTAIDLSRASLAYAQRKTAELGLTNVAYAQADLLELREGPFDVIEASGSLHHLEDPLAGAVALTRLLRPGGLFRFGLYSRLGRRRLQPARDLARGFPVSADGIRALRAAIAASPPGDPVRAAAGSSDFYSLSECRDLLMHVQEHQLDIADLGAILEACGLRFLGFVLRPQAMLAYRQANPEDPAGLDLDRWAAFEARHPDTFARMYDFWAQKSG